MCQNVCCKHDLFTQKRSHRDQIKLLLTTELLHRSHFYSLRSSDQLVFDLPFAWSKTACVCASSPFHLHTLFCRLKSGFQYTCSFTLFIEPIFISSEAFTRLLLHKAVILCFVLLYIMSRIVPSRLAQLDFRLFKSFQTLWCKRHAKLDNLFRKSLFFNWKEFLFGFVNTKYNICEFSGSHL